MSKLSRKSLRVYLLSAAPTLFFLTGIFIPKGSVILLALIVILIFISTKRSKLIELFSPNNTWYTIALFIVFSATSAFWSLTPVNTLYKVLPLTAMLLLALIAINFAMAFVDDEIEALRKGIIIGGFSGFLLLGAELSSDAYITRLLRPSLWELTSVDELYHMTKILNGGVAIASLFFWPWFLVVWTAFK